MPSPLLVHAQFVFQFSLGGIAVGGHIGAALLDVCYLDLDLDLISRIALGLVRLDGLDSFRKRGYEERPTVDTWGHWKRSIELGILS